MPKQQTVLNPRKTTKRITNVPNVGVIMARVPEKIKKTTHSASIASNWVCLTLTQPVKQRKIVTIRMVP